MSNVEKKKKCVNKKCSKKNWKNSEKKSKKNNNEKLSGKKRVCIDCKMCISFVKCVYLSKFSHSEEQRKREKEERELQKKKEREDKGRNFKTNFLFFIVVMLYYFDPFHN